MTFSLTIILILVNVAASIYAFQNEAVMRRWMLNPYTISRRNEYWRFITSGFIHADWGHLIFNMISLYFFGDIVERTLAALAGPDMAKIMYLALYLLGIIISDLPTFFQHRNDPGYNSLGASGGVSSVVFAGIVFYPLAPIYIFFIPIGIPGFIFGFLYLAYSYYEARRGAGYVNHSAHLWGAMFGVLFVVLLVPDVVPAFIEQIRSYRGPF
ncbi:MAG: rhomboid family intramembrane serine protease [Cytophagaceae bacterium]|nr:rhomboid family intramembrane serine protease [Cytophagaceae bacterium]